jgi:hypothetical protein
VREYSFLTPASEKRGGDIVKHAFGGQHRYHKIEAGRILIWVGFTSKHETAARPAYGFPALLDTGLNGFVAMKTEQFVNWTGLAGPAGQLPPPTNYRSLNQALVRNDQGPSCETRRDIRIPVVPVRLWLFRNVPGQSDPNLDDAVALDVDGVMIYPPEIGDAPSTPTLGLQTLQANKLKLVVDGQRDRVGLGRGLIGPWTWWF